MKKLESLITNEPFEINGINNNRVATAITSFGSKMSNHYMVALIMVMLVLQKLSMEM